MPELANYLPIAKRKLQSLMDEAGFSQVESISDESEGPVFLAFHSGKRCSIDRWGRVIWLHLDELSGNSG
ncbi:MAG: hypothetical protein R3Y30_18925 [Vibrio sp.]